MLPPAIYMHIVESSHSESHSGGSVKLLQLIFRGNFREMVLQLLPPSLGSPYRGPPAMGSTAHRGVLGGKLLRQQGWAL